MMPPLLPARPCKPRRALPCREPTEKHSQPGRWSISVQAAASARCQRPPPPRKLLHPLSSRPLRMRRFILQVLRAHRQTRKIACA